MEVSEDKMFLEFALSKLEEVQLKIREIGGSPVVFVRALTLALLEMTAAQPEPEESYADVLNAMNSAWEAYNAGT